MKSEKKQEVKPEKNIRAEFRAGARGFQALVEEAGPGDDVSGSFVKFMRTTPPQTSDERNYCASVAARLYAGGSDDIVERVYDLDENTANIMHTLIKENKNEERLSRIRSAESHRMPGSSVIVQKQTIT